MTPSPEVRHRMNTVTIGGATLRVDLAVQMLERSGMDGLSRLEPGSPAWLQALIDGLCMLSSRDPMTGLVNRRQFETSLEGEIDRVARSGESAMLLLIDIDHFKRVNDSYGHGTGDQVLCTVAAALQAGTPDNALAARIGGEEFVMLLPAMQLQSARLVAEQLRQKVALLRTPARSKTGAELQVQVTVSIGLTSLQRGETGRQFIERADQALYQSKHGGRDRITVRMG